MANANAMRNISESEQFQQYTAFYNDNRQQAVLIFEMKSPLV